jgi:hypothetical protein
MSQSARNRVRGAINAAAETFFGTAVAIEERVFQAFMVQTNFSGAPHEGHVWRQLTRVVPSMSALHDMLNADIVMEGWPENPRALTEWTAYSHEAKWWLPMFGRLFGVRTLDWGSRQYTAAAQSVIATKVLTVDQLVQSILECGQYTTTSRSARKTNVVTRRLAEASGLGKVKRWSDDVDRFTQQVASTFQRLRAADGSLGEQQFLLSLDGARVRLKPFGVFGAYQFSDLHLPDGSLWVARSNVIQPSTTFSADALEELEDLIASEAGEATFQRFFERHDEFLLALGEYARIHSQLILHEDGGERLIPDFFLERIDSDMSDICDLKLPSTELVRQQRHRHRFRDAVMEGVAQLMTYRDWFDDRQHRELFRATYGLTAFRPRVVLVIGRRTSFEDDIERMRLESALPGFVQLKTYDDIVARARQWRLLATRDTVASPTSGY